MNKLRRLPILLIVMTAGLAMIGACTGPIPPSSEATLPAEETISKALLSKDDLPTGWYEVKVKSPNVPDAITRAVDFQGASDLSLSWVKVLQEVYLYPTQELATSAYHQFVTQLFPGLGTDGWQPTHELLTSSHANQITIACLPVQINRESVTSCSSVAQYQTLIVVIHSNLLKDRWMTEESFRKVLEAMDKRANEASANQPR
jgi:hypothetical protein